jgi:hypothetical protein
VHCWYIVDALLVNILLNTGLFGITSRRPRFDVEFRFDVRVYHVFDGWWLTTVLVGTHFIKSNVKYPCYNRFFLLDVSCLAGTVVYC